MMQRLRTDFDLAIVTLFSVLGIVGITPFAIFRFIAGDMKASIMDALIVVGIVIGLVYAWRSNNTKRAGELFVLISNLGCVASASLLGLAGLFWTFPVLLVNFMVLGRRVAVAVSLCTLAVLIIHGKAFESQLETMMFLVTAIVVALLALIFSYRTATQRQLLEDLSLSDPLTGAKNRRAMNLELAYAIKDHQKNKTQYGLLMLDMDHFKNINDRYGHEEGDDVLIRFSALVKKHSRKTDRFFRMGGEEFLLLLPDADAASLPLIAEHHRSHIEANLHCNEKAATVSIGAAMLLPGENQQQWLARADAALYAAKNNGRNCVVIATETAIHTVK
jgi:diguanylate cyclase